MLDFIFSKQLTNFTYINYAALIAFTFESIAIVLLKSIGVKRCSEWMYLDFFITKNLLISMSLRFIILVISVCIFLTDSYHYRFLSNIFLVYIFVFIGTCGWMYAHFKGYTKESKSDDQRT